MNTLKTKLLNINIYLFINNSIIDIVDILI